MVLNHCVILLPLLSICICLAVSFLPYSPLDFLLTCDHTSSPYLFFPSFLVTSPSCPPPPTNHICLCSSSFLRPCNFPPSLFFLIYSPLFLHSLISAFLIPPSILHAPSQRPTPHIYPFNISSPLVPVSPWPLWHLLPAQSPHLFVSSCSHPDLSCGKHKCHCCAIPLSSPPLISTSLQSWLSLQERLKILSLLYLSSPHTRTQTHRNILACKCAHLTVF